MLRYVLGWVVACLVVGPAAMAEQAPPAIEDYGKLPTLSHATLSPSGQRYAVIAKVDGKLRLLIETTDNKPLMAQTLGAVKVRGLEWAGEDHVLLYTSATVQLGFDFTVDKDELNAVVVLDVAHRKEFSVFITPPQSRVANTVAGSYGTGEIKGKWYGFFGAFSYDESGVLKRDADERLYEDLYKVDLDTGAFELAAEGQSRVRRWLVGRDGQIAARLLYDIAKGDWRLRSLGFGGRELAKGASSIGDVDLMGFGRTPDSLLLWTGGADHNVVQEIATADGQVRATFDSADIGEPLFDRTNGLWIGETAEVDDAISSKLFDDRNEAKLRGSLKAFPGYIPHLVSYSADFNRMMVFTDGGDDSGTYWIVDIDKHTAVPIGQEYPTVPPEFVGSVRWIDYKAADGLPMRGVLTLPPGRAPRGLPLVVMPHGGPEAHDTLGFDYWAQAFASRGYAVWQPNFRGSTGAGNAFRDAGHGEWGRKMQTDISDGVAELARQGLVDPKRACIVGGSYGGYAALAGVTVQQGLYRCAVSYGGVTDLPRMLDDEAQARGYVSATMRYWKQFMGVKPGSDPHLADISPARLASRADAPILLIYGKDDTVVLPDQSLRMEQALRRAGKSVELVVYPGTDHWLLEEPSRMAMVKASVEFVLKHNPAVAPAAATGATIAAPAPKTN